MEFVFSILSTLLLASICIVIYLLVKNKKLQAQTRSGSIVENRVTLKISDSVYRTPISQDPCGYVDNYINVQDGTDIEVPNVQVTFLAVSRTGRFLIKADSDTYMWVKPSTLSSKYTIRTETHPKSQPVKKD